MNNSNDRSGGAPQQHAFVDSHSAQLSTNSDSNNSNAALTVTSSINNTTMSKTEINLRRLLVKCEATLLKYKKAHDSISVNATLTPTPIATPLSSLKDTAEAMKPNITDVDSVISSKLEWSATEEIKFQMQIEHLRSLLRKLEQESSISSNACSLHSSSLDPSKHSTSSHHLAEYARKINTLDQVVDKSKLVGRRNPDSTTSSVASSRGNLADTRVETDSSKTHQSLFTHSPTSNANSNPHSSTSPKTPPTSSSASKQIAGVIANESNPSVGTPQRSLKDAKEELFSRSDSELRRRNGANSSSTFSTPATPSRPPPHSRSSSSPSATRGGDASTTASRSDETQLLLSAQAKQQEDISEQLMHLSSRLKTQSLTFQELLQKDSKVVKDSFNTLSSNVSRMDQNRKELNKFSEKQGWTKILFVWGSFVLVTLIFIAVYILIKILPSPRR